MLDILLKAEKTLSLLKDSLQEITLVHDRMYIFKCERLQIEHCNNITKMIKKKKMYYCYEKNNIEMVVVGFKWVEMSKSYGLIRLRCEGGVLVYTDVLTKIV